MSSGKQFNYRKLVNERAVTKHKPDRPPPPQVSTSVNSEGLLIDISPQDTPVIYPPHTDNRSSTMSLLDEPIDVLQDNGEYFPQNKVACLLKLLLDEALVVRGDLTNMSFVEGTFLNCL